MKTKTKPDPGDKDKEGEGKRGRGRPAFEPTNEQRGFVRGLAGIGTTQEAICRLFGKSYGTPISKDTLAVHFRAELDVGVDEANAKIAKVLFDQAMAGNMTAIIFWLKTRARWKETPQQHAFTDPDGNPVPAPSLADFYNSVQMVAAGAKESGDAG